MSRILVRWVIAMTATIGLGGAAACSSSAVPPPTGDSEHKPVDSGADADASVDDSVGAWPCYPETGDYLTHFTRTAGDAKACPDIPDTKTRVGNLRGPLPEFPGCTSSADKASCTVTFDCQQKSALAVIDENTVTIYQRGQIPPVKGTRHTVTHEFRDGGTKDGGAIDGGTIDTPCTYEFSYSKM